MKKILSLLLLSSPIFSMQLALQMQTPRLNRFRCAVVKQQKAIVSQTQQVVSQVIDTPKVHISASSIRAPHTLADIKLYHGKKGFVILQNDKKHVIEKCFMDQTARSITKEDLKSFLKKGYFVINQTNDGTFTLKAHQRLVGGGPLFGKIMYWATKVTCYGVLAAGAGVIVICGGRVGTGGTTHSTTSDSSPVISAMVQNASGAGILESGAAATATTASGTVAFSPIATTACMTGAGVIATGLNAAGYAPACAKATGAALATGSSGGGIVAGIEAISLAVGIFCGFTPTP